MRHVCRVHDVSGKWLHEPVTLGRQVSIVYCVTDAMRAGVLTNAFTNFDKRVHALSRIGVRIPTKKGVLASRKGLQPLRSRTTTKQSVTSAAEPVVDPSGTSLPLLVAA